MHVVTILKVVHDISEKNYILTSIVDLIFANVVSVFAVYK